MEFHLEWCEVISFNDTMVLYKRAAPIDSIINRSVRICSPDTFLIMMTPVRKQDYSIRQLLRKIIPQGLVIQGKKINRVFIVSIMDNEREQIKEIRKEMEQYGDIIISRHEDAHSSIHLYVWDGYLWIRDHCHSAVFAGKFETDAVHFWEILFLFYCSIQQNGSMVEEHAVLHYMQESKTRAYHICLLRLIIQR